MKANISVRFVTARCASAARDIVASSFKTRDAASEPLFIGAPTEKPFNQHKPMKLKSIIVSFALASLCVAQTFAVSPLGTAFTYQGRLSESGQPANGYYDILFSLMDAATNGSSVGPVMPMPAVAVSNGYFTVELDFGANAFNGSGRWLDIGVRTNCNCLASYTLLSPRQPLTPAPCAQYAANAAQAATTTYAQFATNAAQATTALSANSAGSVAWANITGIPAGFADGVDNNTTYAAGAGLTLAGASNQFSINFAGSGSADTAARSDHGHFGEFWSGSSSGFGLSVVNSSTTGSGFFTQQGTGSGAAMPFGYKAAAWAESSQGDAIFGASGNAFGTGIYGYATHPNGANYGVYGQSDSPSGVGVFARGSGTTGTALKISNGALRVAGVGTNSPTPLFLHVVKPSNLRTNAVFSWTVIDNPYCNNDPNAILLVTPNWGRFSDFNWGSNVSPVYDDGSAGYATNRWILFPNDGGGASLGTKYNVLVFKQ